MPAAKRRRGGDDDDFGADDADWGVYRSVASGATKGDSDDEEEGEEDLEAAVRALEEDLLQYDEDLARMRIPSTLKRTGPNRCCTPSGTAPALSMTAPPGKPTACTSTWNGIRVPEVVFQPNAIAGVDQAGIVEIASDILNQRLLGIPGLDRDAFLKDIFLTGGNTLFQNFDERLRSGLTALLPADAPPRVRRAKNALDDAWKGCRWLGRHARLETCHGDERNTRRRARII